MKEQTIPAFPFKEGARPYQHQAYERWRSNDCQGFFAMATGTGKTITALNCLLHLYQEEKQYQCVILVPTMALVEQWVRECQNFHFVNIVKISSKEKTWKDDVLRIITSSYLNPKEVSFVVVATYASFAKPETFTRLQDFPTTTLLIADEAHNMGSPLMLKAMKQLTYKRRIGLSATPDRQFDHGANKAIRNFFAVQEGYTFEYNMAEAIKKGVLCKYRYFPHVVKLSEDETWQYMVLSRQIAKFYREDTDEFEDNPILTALLLKRKRIIHKAVGKLAVFKSIMTELFHEKGNLKYTMVYAPEGISPTDVPTHLFEDDDRDEEQDDEEVPMINLYTTLVSGIDKSILVEQFTSKEKDRERILDDFSHGETHVLVAMKCLDEGVDVPRAETAVFCASTGNPRQFIQRRGRILRNHSEKELAVIHDLVVVPFVDSTYESFQMEKSLIQRELKRVSDFASLATNSFYAESVLSEIAEYYDLNLYNDEQN
jgi:superfamily II DNA or RNA helicase